MKIKDRTEINDLKNIDNISGVDSVKPGEKKSPFENPQNITFADLNLPKW